MDQNDHQAHEQRLAAALRDLVHQADIGAYRDALGHPLQNNMAFLKAEAIVNQFGLTHEQLCRSLDDCDLEGDLRDAARKIFELRTAKPSSTPAGIPDLDHRTVTRAPGARPPPQAAFSSSSTATMRW